MKYQKWFNSSTKKRFILHETRQTYLAQKGQSALCRLAFWIYNVENCRNYVIATFNAKNNPAGTVFCLPGYSESFDSGVLYRLLINCSAMQSSVFNRIFRSSSVHARNLPIKCCTSFSCAGASG